jgi:hypothetical protein
VQGSDEDEGKVSNKDKDDLKPRKFGYMVYPPPPFPPHPPAPPPGIHVSDWIAYINSYIDARARQIYEKVKGLVQESGIQSVGFLASSAISPSSSVVVGTLDVDGA